MQSFFEQLKPSRVSKKAMIRLCMRKAEMQLPKPRHNISFVFLRAMRHYLPLAMVLVMPLATAKHTDAYEIPTTTSGSWNGTGTTATATKKMPSGLQVNVSVTGAGMSFGNRIDTSLTMSNNTTVPNLPTNTNGIQVIVSAISNCNNLTLNPDPTFCTGLGSLNFSFTDPTGNPVKVQNPVLHLSRMGGFVTQTGGTTIGYTLASILDLTTPGITLGTAPATNKGFYINNGNQLSPKSGGSSYLPGFKSSTASSPFAGMCGLNGAAPQAGCGTVPIIGTTSSLGFNLSMARAFISADTSLPWVGAKTGADGIYFTFSADEDFGDAPATYDAGVTGAASHIISDLKLGQMITADNSTTINGGATGTPLITTSPKAVAASANNNASNGDGTSDDGVASFPVFSTTSTGSYAVPVSLTGASRAGQVCGWVDFNKSNAFDTGERACTAFVSGATSVNLTWTLPAGMTAGNTYARIRASYDTAGVQNPTGPLSSGEVEDYQLTIASPPAVGAFTCDSSIYLSQASATTSLSKITPTNAASNPYSLTSIGASSAIIYNGIGYRSQNDFIYATTQLSNAIVASFTIYRINSSGTVSSVTSVNFAGIYASHRKTLQAGAFDANGSYYIPVHYVGASTVDEILKIDFNASGTPVALNTLTTSQNFTQDIAFNPLDGFFYGYVGAGTPNLYKINPATGAASLVPGGSAGVAGSFDSLVIDANGNAYATLAAGGTYSVNLATGAATKIGNTTITGTPGIDGTICPLAALSLKPNISGYKSVKITTDAGVPGSADPNDVLTYSVTYVNTGTAFANNFQVSDVLPANVTLNGTPAVNFTGTGTAATVNASYNGTSNTNLLSSGAVLANGNGTITVSVPVKINAGYAGDLYNQASATSSEITSPVKTDNLDNSNTGLLFTVPSGSLTQTQTAVLDKTYVQVTALKLSLAGKVWNDLDGDGSLNGGELVTDTNPNGQSNNLYAVLTDDLGKVLQVVPIDDATGTYSFTGISPNQAVKVLLSTTSPTIGSDFIASALPAGWVGTLPGDSILSATTGIVNITGKDFGIEQPPVAVGQSATSQSNPGGTTTVDVPSSIFTNSTDPSSTVAAYKIADFPSNTTSVTINGNVYTALDFPEGGVVLTATELNTPGSFKVDPIDGAVTVQIPFQAIDFAGRVSSNIDIPNLPFTPTPANVVLVKRITAINGVSTINPNNNTTPLNQVKDNPATPNDNPGVNWPPVSVNWPNGYLVGAYDGGLVKPGDIVEYTVYFLNAQGSDASNVRICDRILGEQQFYPDAYGTGKDLEYRLGTNPVQYLTKASLTSVDRGELNPSTSAIAGCPDPDSSITGTNNGTVVVDVTSPTLTTSSGQQNILTLPGATSAGNPTNSYGYFRFKVKVNP
jgi:uncharacterized repeat protein (TIGR01451 family)